MLETKLLQWFWSLIINKRTQSLGLLRSLESMYIGEIREGEREFVCVRVVVGCELWLYWSLAGEALRAECCWRCCWLLIVVLCGFWLLISYHCALLPNFLQGQKIRHWRHCTVCVCMRNLFYFPPKFFRYYSFADYFFYFSWSFQSVSKLGSPLRDLVPNLGWLILQTSTTTVPGTAHFLLSPSL